MLRRELPGADDRDMEGLPRLVVRRDPAGELPARLAVRAGRSCRRSSSGNRRGPEAWDEASSGSRASRLQGPALSRPSRANASGPASLRKASGGMNPPSSSSVMNPSFARAFDRAAFTRWSFAGSAHRPSHTAGRARGRRRAGRRRGSRASPRGPPGRERKMHGDEAPHGVHAV